jgi:hypothetical protein
MTCYVQLSGGLGNQLFEIAAGYAHCARTGKTLQLSRTTNCKRCTYWDTFTHKCAPYISDPPRTRVYQWREPYFHYAPINPAADAITGYFQSSKYFADVSSQIHALFEPDLITKEILKSKYADLLTPNMKARSIVLHIRRGDYVALPQYHCILTPDYYRRVVAEAHALIPNSHILVFSDDLDWCRTLDFLADGATTFVDEPSDFLSLHMMTQFRHYILSNSSFSWWAAWLGERAATVWAPNRWFGHRGPQDVQDIYEPDWIRVHI